MSAGHRRRLSNPESQAQYLYEARGNSSQALNAYNGSGMGMNESGGNVNVNVDVHTNSNGNSHSNNGSHEHQEANLNPSRHHNMALLRYLEDAKKDTEQAYLIALKELHSNKDSQRDKYSKHKELSLHELVLAYNLALHSFFAQEYREAEKVIFPIFKNISNNEEDVRYIRYGDIKCKIAFLLVDCILGVFEVEIVDEILEWIDKFIASRPDSAVDEHTDGSSYTKESTMQLKFRMHCYKARYLFLDAHTIPSEENENENAKSNCNAVNNSNNHEKENNKFDANTRSARKELKNAMEIYHHQLSGKKTAANSLGDGTTTSLNSVEYGSGSLSQTQDHEEGNVSISNPNGIGNDPLSPNDNRLPFEIKKSEAQNRHVLFLKANLEFMKGHTKKSLKLCSETQNTVDRDNGDASLGNSGSLTSRVSQSTHMEHALYNNNVAIVHQAAGQPYLAMHYYAHALSHLEQMQADGIKINSDGAMTNLSVVPTLYNAAICAKQTGNFSSAYELMSRYMDLSPYAVQHPLPWLHLGQSCVGLYSTKKSGRKRWSRGPDSTNSELLSNALSNVTKCITICHNCHHKPSHHAKILEAARVSLAFIFMELQNPAPVTHLADLVLREPLPTNDDNEKIESQSFRATIRLYAYEAMSLMGNPSGALKYLPPDHVDSVVGHLSNVNTGESQNCNQDDLKASIMMSLDHLSASISEYKD